MMLFAFIVIDIKLKNFCLMVISVKNYISIRNKKDETNLLEFLLFIAFYSTITQYDYGTEVYMCLYAHTYTQSPKFQVGN